MSEVGRLSAALTLDGAAEFQRQLQSVGQQFQEAGSKGRSFGQLGAQAFKTAAGATTGLIAAGGAYLTVLTKTGVAYNSLQQNSRAALGVLLGGTEKANAQMDKLDAFARNSPFSKSVFIDAQQQLLGFGVEAQKVVPYLDAVQNAVAATGGSSNEIAGLVEIMAKIQSSAKITAEDLNMFGTRGVDAASIIGAEMGKTAAEIRSEISDGALDAGEALDALANGMQTKFGGTTELVKQQWTGATDRIKAANRDIGAIIAEPFVAKNGGGMAVTWGNQVADVLRAVEKQAKPVMEILTVRGAGLFSGLTQGLDSAQASIQRFNPDRISVALDKLAGHGPAIGAMTGAVLALGSSVGPLGSLFGMLGVSINPVVAALVGIAAASPEVRAGFAQVLEAGQPLLGVAGELASVLSGALTSAMPVVATGLGLIADVAGPLVDVVAAIPAPVLIGAAAFLALHKATGPLAGGLVSAGSALARFAQQSQVQASLGGTSTAMGAIATGSMRAKDGVALLGNALKTAFLANPIGLVLTAVSLAIGAWAAANASAQAKVQAHNDRVAELKSTLNETTGATTDATRAQIEKNLAEGKALKVAEEMGISQRDLTDAVLGSESALAKVTKGMDDHAAATTLGDKNLNTWSATAQNGANRVRILNEALDEQIAAQKDAQQAVKDAARAQQEASAAMGETGRNAQKLKDALQVASDASRDAEERLNALRQALDLLNGGSKSAAEAELEHAKQVTTLKDALGQTIGESEKFVDVLNASGGALDLQSTEAQRLADVMLSLNRATESQAMAAADAKIANGDYSGAFKDVVQAMNEGRESFMATAAEMGLNTEAAAALADKYFSIPTQVATALTTEGVDDASALLALILTQMSLISEGEQVTIPVDAPGAEEAKAALEGLGYVVTDTPDGKNFLITAQGAEETAAQIESLVATEVPEKIFKVDAETADAVAKIDGVQVVKIDDKWSYVYGENADAIAKIEAVKTNTPSAKVVTITAEDSGFWGAWGRIAGAAMSKLIGIGGSKSDYAGGMYGPAGKQFYGGGFADGDVKHFAGGGYPSGIYTGVQGGLWRMGVDGVPHNFAEAELGVPWEVYISGKSGNRSQNIGYALEALRRLGAPSVPLAALGGTPVGRRFADGGGVAAGVGHVPVSGSVAPDSMYGGPLIGSVYLGEGTKKDDLVELERRLDHWRRGGR